jgi:hypothetical protein
VVIAITKYPKRFDADAQILMYWLMFCRAPGRKTLPGEPVDLGEIGNTREKNWERMTPYSVAERKQEMN